MTHTCCTLCGRTAQIPISCQIMLLFDYVRKVNLLVKTADKHSWSWAKVHWWRKEEIIVSVKRHRVLMLPNDYSTREILTQRDWSQVPFHKSAPILVSFRPQHIWRCQRLHQDAVFGPEHEKGRERNLQPHDLCHGHKERRDCVQCCDGHHHQRKP